MQRGSECRVAAHPPELKQYEAKAWTENISVSCFSYLRENLSKKRECFLSCVAQINSPTHQFRQFGPLFSDIVRLGRNSVAMMVEMKTVIIMFQFFERFPKCTCVLYDCLKINVKQEPRKSKMRNPDKFGFN